MTNSLINCQHHRIYFFTKKNTTTFKLSNSPSNFKISYILPQIHKFPRPQFHKLLKDWEFQNHISYYASKNQTSQQNVQNKGGKIKQNSPILISSSKFHSKNLNVKKPGSGISPNEEIKKYKRKESLIKSREEMAKYLGKKELKIGKIENPKR